ncbi:prepilin peptidase [Candidatus Poribacteria bacterium]|nr:prepilin peptidase [Candidatus Poribacteria bacterium]
MCALEMLFIGIALAFCFYASYTDLKEGKIKNWANFTLIYAGLLSQLIFLIKGSISKAQIASNIFSGAFLMILLHWFGALAAGDAKMLWGCRCYCRRRSSEHHTLSSECPFQHCW